jgi:hypothetical protein
MTIKAVAESGIFNLPGYTPLHSAERANLYEAFQYLAAKAAESKAQAADRK